MKRVLFVMFACVACQAPSASPPPLTTPPFEIRAPVHECSVEGAACESSGAMCPVPGVCRAGTCVPSRVGALAAPSPPFVSFSGNFKGAMREDGAAYVRAGGIPLLFGFGVDEETADVEVQLVSGRIGLGGEGDWLNAVDLDTKTLRWTATLGSTGWLRFGADTGQGVVAFTAQEGSPFPASPALTFVRLVDGVVLRTHRVEGRARGLASDEEGRVFLRSGDDTACRLDAYGATGERLWTSESACNYSQPVVHAGRLFDGVNVRDTATGRVTFHLDPGFHVYLATDEVIVAASDSEILELRDPTTLERRFRQGGAGIPFAITSRGTVLTTTHESVHAGNWCSSSCSYYASDLREYGFDGRLVGLCEARSTDATFLTGGVVWLAFDGTNQHGYSARPVPGYDLALHGWVTTYGTPGAQRRPR